MAAPIRTRNGAISFEGDIAPLHRLMRRLAADTARPIEWRTQQMGLVSTLINALNDDLQKQAAARDEQANKRSGSKPEQPDGAAQ